MPEFEHSGVRVAVLAIGEWSLHIMDTVLMPGATKKEKSYTLFVFSGCPCVFQRNLLALSVSLLCENWFRLL